ncbi:hypothetical protein SNEBB_010104 [Seison nebaliae]|nr:hypothetical protein SNEBB_010104 [Seison nebaliae]
MLKKVFDKYFQFGRGNDEEMERRLTSQDVYHMMHDHEILNKQYQQNDLDIDFFKIIGDMKHKRPDNYKKDVKTLDFEGFKELVRYISVKKGMDYTELTGLLGNGSPRLSDPTKVLAMDVTERLTDVSQYRGMHAERFDENGNGLGLAGRDNLADDDGYVSGYNNKGKWDKQHPHM